MKMHVSEDGKPRECKATFKECPVNANDDGNGNAAHGEFRNAKDAQAFAEEINLKRYGRLAPALEGVSKGADTDRKASVFSRISGKLISATADQRAKLAELHLLHRRSKAPLGTPTMEENHDAKKTIEATKNLDKYMDAIYSEDFEGREKQDKKFKKILAKAYNVPLDRVHVDGDVSAVYQDGVRHEIERDGTHHDVRKFDPEGSMDAGIIPEWRNDADPRKRLCQAKTEVLAREFGVAPEDVVHMDTGKILVMDVAYNKAYTLNKNGRIRKVEPMDFDKYSVDEAYGKMTTRAVTDKGRFRVSQNGIDAVLHPVRMRD